MHFSTFPLYLILFYFYIAHIPIDIFSTIFRSINNEHTSDHDNDNLRFDFENSVHVGEPNNEENLDNDTLSPDLLRFVEQREEFKNRIKKLWNWLI